MGNRLCFLMYIYVLNSTLCFNLIAVLFLVSAVFVKFFKLYCGQSCASWGNEVYVKSHMHRLVLIVLKKKTTKYFHSVFK